MSSSDSENTQPIRRRAASQVRTAEHQVQSADTDQTQPVHTGKKLASAEKTQPVRLKARALAQSARLAQPAGQPQPATSLWRDARRQVLRSPEAVASLVVIGLFIFMAIFASWIAPYTLLDTHITNDNLPPFWVQHPKIGHPGDIRFLLGTDQLGRDLLSWAIYGTRTSMTVGLVSAPLIGLIGMLVGLISGYAGGRTDRWMMRVTDVFYAFPPLMICILVVLILRPTEAGKWLNGLVMLFIAFLSVGWAGAARLTRASVLSVKHLEYIEAARCLGVPTRRILFKHVLPNCLGPLIVWVTLMVPQLILTEAILAYLRITPGQMTRDGGLFAISWGGMLLEGRSMIHVQPAKTIIPALCVGLIAIAFTFLGDALRDALDPARKSA